MSYTNEDYAEKAIEANNLGKLLIINDNDELEIVDIIKTEDDIIGENIAKKSVLISCADKEIAILQDSFDLDMQEEGDEERLKEWKKYRILLSRVDLTIDSVEWPTKPI